MHLCWWGVEPNVVLRQGDVYDAVSRFDVGPRPRPCPTTKVEDDFSFHLDSISCLLHMQHLFFIHSQLKRLYNTTGVYFSC